MATANAPVARLSAAAAMVVAVALALMTPSGPWQPASVILGWAAVVAVAVGTVSGSGTWVATAAILTLVRFGVGGLADQRTPSLALSAFLLVILVEAAAVSFEARLQGMDVVTVLARTVTPALVAAGMVAVLEDSVLGPGWQGASAQLLGLMVAMGAVWALLAIQHRRPEEGQGRRA